MKLKVLKYKSYHGSVEVSSEGNFLFGKIMGVRDVVTFEASTLKLLRKAFVEAVNDYLQTREMLARRLSR